MHRFTNGQQKTLHPEYSWATNRSSTFKNQKTDASVRQTLHQFYSRFLDKSKSSE